MGDAIFAELNAMKGLSLLLVGWLLGLLSPVITEKIKHWYEDRAALVAIKIELTDVALKLAAAAHFVDVKNGTATKESMGILLRKFQDFKRSHTVQRDIDEISALLKLSDGEFSAWVEAHRDKSRRSLDLHKYGIPVIDSRIAEVRRMSPELQGALLSIKDQVRMLDALVDRVDRWSAMSFAKHEGDDHERVMRNLEGVITQYGKRARLVSRDMDFAAKLK